MSTTPDTLQPDILLPLGFSPTSTPHIFGWNIPIAPRKSIRTGDTKPPRPCFTIRRFLGPTVSTSLPSRDFLTFPTSRHYASTDTCARARLSICRRTWRSIGVSGGKRFDFSFQLPHSFVFSQPIGSPLLEHFQGLFSYLF